MKKIYFLFLFITGAMLAQIPQGFSYQAIALNASGTPVISAPVKVRLSILDNSVGGAAIYTETHNPSTNGQGLFSLTIGQGTSTTGAFSAINWVTNSKFLKVEIDTNNGTNYVVVGTSQLLSVPYAMVAGTTSGYLPIATRAEYITDSSKFYVAGLIMPTLESLSYTESGFVVGTSPNVVYGTSIYRQTASGDYGKFAYSFDRSTYLSAIQPSVSNQNLYIKTYVKTQSGQYLYGNEVIIQIP